MKNLHIIATDKPSRLFIHSFDLDLRLDIKSVNHPYAKNIYITNDEEIKEGDIPCWVISDIKTAIPHKLKDYQYRKLYTYKKIILTTDQDLIKDGVQKIDDDFLEWFVKNPSCEEIQTIRVSTWCNDGKVCVCNVPKFCNEKRNGFKYIIIIPKEEPKQNKTCILCDGTGETTFSGTYNSQRKCDVCNGKGYIGLDVIKQAKDDLQLIKSLQETKQETIQEVELAILFHNTYEKLAPSFGYETRLDTKSFETTTPNGKLMIAVCKEIIKWQKEQDKNKYSEEEVIELLTKRCEFLGTSLSPFNELLLKQDLEWFNEFKKL